MVTKVVNLKDFAGVMRDYQHLSLRQQKAVVAKSIADNFKDIVKNSPVDTGLFAQSWDMIEDEKSIMIGNYAPHAAIIEFGARPFRPPIKPLLDWARRVLQRAEHDSDVWALAKYTQAKIEAQGMKPKHILTDSLNKILNDIRINLKREFG